MKDLMQIDAKDAGKYLLAMTEFQHTHNELRKDFLTIYELVANLEESHPSYKPLVRACIKELFSLIEGDIYLYNQYNKYSDYNDKHGLTNKFKRTFKQHGRVFNRTTDVLTFNSLNFSTFKKLKDKRDDITHPKSLGSLTVDKSILLMAYDFYIAYTDFVNHLMTNTAFSYSIPFDFKSTGKISN